jgi:hypothetical protein
VRIRSGATLQVIPIASKGRNLTETGNLAKGGRKGKGKIVKGCNAINQRRRRERLRETNIFRFREFAIRIHVGFQDCGVTKGGVDKAADLEDLCYPVLVY